MQEPIAQDTPPFDQHAESAVLGSILSDSDSYRQVATFLDAPDFYSEANRWVYSAMAKLAERNEKIDAVTTAHQLVEDEHDEQIGVSQLVRLVEATPTSEHILTYARIVHWCSRARKGIEIMKKRMTELHVVPSLVDSTLRKTANEVAEIYEDSPDSNQHNLRELLDEVLAEMSDLDNPMRKIGTGFKYLDTKLSGGFTPEELVIIGGRPGGGKSVIAMQLGLLAVRIGMRALAFTMEMGGKQVVRRMIAAETGLDSGTLDDSVRFQRNDLETIQDAIGALSDIGENFIIDDSAAPSIEYIRNIVMADASAGTSS